MNVKRSNRQEEMVSVLLEVGRSREALSILNLMFREASSLTPEQKARWSRLQMQGSMRLRDLPGLLAVYNRLPELLQSDESASMLVIEALIATNQSEGAAKLRGAWSGRETHPEFWICYDARQLLRNGKPDEAVALLKSASFPSKADCGRLFTLALACADKCEESQGFFNHAQVADPWNPDLGIVRAQILERTGEVELARVEFAAALAAAPTDALVRNEVVNFYLRQRYYTMAVRTIADGLRPESFDTFWLKTAFWSRVTTFLRTNEPPRPCPPGTLQPLVKMLHDLPADEFWNEGAFQKLMLSPQEASRFQEIFWLRLLEHLRNGCEEEAAGLLAGNPFQANSFHPILEKVLGIILAWRQNQTPPSPGALDADAAAQHPFFESIVAWSRGEPAPETEAFVAGPHAFAGACAAASWVEATLKLSPEDHAAPDAPEWFVRELAQALATRSRTRALESCVASSE